MYWSSKMIAGTDSRLPTVRPQSHRCIRTRSPTQARRARRPDWDWASPAAGRVKCTDPDAEDRALGEEVQPGGDVCEASRADLAGALRFCGLDAAIGVKMCATLPSPGAAKWINPGRRKTSGHSLKTRSRRTQIPRASFRKGRVSQSATALRRNR